MILQKNKKKGVELPPSDNSKFLRYSPHFIFIIAFLIYLPTIKSGFVYCDDDIVILDNYNKIKTFSNLFSAFTHDAYFSNSYPYYRPLLTTTLILDAQLGGKEPGIYHFSNLLIHCLTCLSLFWLLTLLGFNKTKSLFGALLFSVHPLIANAVLFIAARTDQLGTLFALLSFAFIILYFRENKRYQFACHLVFFAGALYSKESALFLPPLYLFYFLLKREKIFNLRILYLFIGWFVIFSSWFYLRSISINNTSLDQISLTSVIKNLAFPAEIISKFLFPVDLSVMPVYTFYNTISGFVFLLFILFLVFKRKQQMNHLVIFGFAWFIALALLNMSSRISNADDNFNYLEQRAYSLSIGLIIILLPLIPDSYLNLKKWSVGLILLILFVTLSALTFHQESKYKNVFNYWTSAIHDFPDRARFHFNFARYYFKQNDLPDFETHLLAAVKLKEDPEFLYNLGMVNAVSKKKYDSAFFYFTEAFKKGLTISGATNNYVTLCIESSIDFFNQKEYAKAIERCSLAIEKDPTNAVAYFNLGIFLMSSQNKQKAMSSWRRSLTLNPELKDAYKYLYYYYLENTTRIDSINYFAGEYQKRGGTILSKK